MTSKLTFDAIEEARPGRKWRARWQRSWPDYEAWFVARGGDSGPSRVECEAALAHHMPELAPVHARLTQLAGGSDRAARFLAGWCPPAYLGGCSLAALAANDDVRLLRNYDLSPELNEGLLLRSEWTGMPVMGMVEFLWGLSDGVNAAGLSVALAFGGRSTVSQGFGITTILRYVLETCASVEQAIATFERIPSHMAYNIVLADRHGQTASVELLPGGGLQRMDRALATNHQHGPELAERPGFTQTAERRAHLELLFSRAIAPDALNAVFMKEPLFRRDYKAGFGTLFTAEYEPLKAALTLHWRGQQWHQSLDAFREGSRTIHYEQDARSEQVPDNLTDALAGLRPLLVPGREAEFDSWLNDMGTHQPDWARFGTLFIPR